MDGLALEGACAAAFRLVDATNEFIASSEPWVLARDEASRGRLDAVLWDAAEGLRIAAVLLAPVMPASASEILARLGVPSDASPASACRPMSAGAPTANGVVRRRHAHVAASRDPARHLP